VKGEDNSVADALSRLPYKFVEKTEQPNAEHDAGYPFSYHAEDPITVFAPKTKPAMCAIVAALVDAAPKNSFRVTIDDELQCSGTPSDRLSTFPFCSGYTPK
jgi:hypothetical protein